MKTLRFFICTALLSLCCTLAASQDKTVRRVIELGRTDNHTMQLEDFLVNRIGGRPVGSHALEDAEKWVEKQFRSWGLEVMVQEVGSMPVGFSRGPWSGRMMSSDGTVTLHFGTPSYTAGTKGPQRGHVVAEPRTRQALERMKGTLKGAWVLLQGYNRGFALDWTADGDARRAKLLEEGDKESIDKEIAIFYREMVDAGVLGFIQSSPKPITILYDRKGCGQLTIDNLPTVCEILLDEDQFAAISKKVSDKEDVLLEFDIRNHFFEGPVKYHNVIGILRGSRYPDEYVITGAHLDSYDSASGAVDDGQGVSVTMESARLLAASGARPLRSIMFAIWTGEEYGLLGSKYFVESGVVPMDKVSNYFNRDGGPQVPTSIMVPEAMYDDFSAICKPLETAHEDFPFHVVKRPGEPRPRPTSAGGSDHAYFAINGVPTLSLMLQDVKGYDFDYREIWHTDRDLYNKAIPEYLEHSATVNAVVVYGVANLRHMLDRTGLYKDE